MGKSSSCATARKKASLKINIERKMFTKYGEKCRWDQHVCTGYGWLTYRRIQAGTGGKQALLTLLTGRM